MSASNPATAAPLVAAPRRRLPRVRLGARFVSPIAILVLWQLASATGVLARRRSSRPRSSSRRPGT